MSVSPENSIECPIAWCTGFRDEHGGDDRDPRSKPAAERGYPAEPAQWVHRSAERDYPGVGYGFWEATGSGPVAYILAAGERAIQRVATSPHELEALAELAELTELATTGRIADLAGNRRLFAMLATDPAGLPVPAKLAAYGSLLAPLEHEAIDELERVASAGTPAALRAALEAASAPIIAELALLASLERDERGELEASAQIRGLAVAWAQELGPDAIL